MCEERSAQPIVLNITFMMSKAWLTRFLLAMHCDQKHVNTCSDAVVTVKYDT